MATGGYVRAAIGPIQEAMRVALGLSDNRMALLQGPAMAVPLVVVALPLGLLIDRYSRARLLVIFTVLSLAGSVATALAASLATLFAARCLVGLMASATGIAALSALADLYAPAQRGRATTVVTISEAAGTSAAFALGGTLLARVGVGPNAWRSTMLLVTAPLLLVVLLLLAAREPRRVGVAERRPPVGHSWPELWRHRGMMAALLTGKIMVGTAYSAVLTWTAPTLSRRFGFSPERVGGIVATGLLMSGILGPIVGGILADLCQRTGGPRRTMALVSMLALMSVGAGSFAMMPEATSASVLLVTFMTLVLVIGVSEMTLSTVVLPSQVRGLGLSILIAAGLVFGTGLAPVTVSLLSGALGGPAAIGTALACVCALTGMLGAVTFAIGRRYVPIQTSS